MLIYKVENTLNGKVYIGKTVKSLKDRRYSHLNSVKNGSNTIFHNSIRKNGKESFKWSVLTETDNESKLNALEKFYITVYRKMGTVYNMTDGGEGSTGMIFSEESKRKMSAAQKGKKHKPLTEEQRRMRAERAKNMSESQREAIRKSNSERVHTEESRRKRSEKKKGQKHSDEAKLKMSLAHKGKIVSEETRRKQGLANSKRIWSDESRKKLSESRKGCIPWNKGLTKSEQTQISL